MQRSREEEVVNAASHFLGAVLASMFTFITIVALNETSKFLPMLLLGGTATWGFLSSFLYHSAKSEMSSRKGFVNDRAGIYIMIAGSGTGLCLAGAATVQSIAISICIILVCFLLITRLCLNNNNSEMFTVLSCVLFGWIAVLPSTGLIMPTKFEDGVLLVLLLAGGLAYSVGVIFYVYDRPWCHAVWHVFVMIGYGLHMTGCYLCLA